MTYYGVSYGSDYVEHAWMIRKKHKYYKRIEKGKGKYRYFYSEKEYQRYLKNRERKQNIKETVADAPESVSKVAKNAIKNVSETGLKVLNKGKQLYYRKINKKASETYTNSRSASNGKPNKSYDPWTTFE